MRLTIFMLAILVLLILPDFQDNSQLPASISKATYDVSWQEPIYQIVWRDLRPEERAPAISPPTPEVVADPFLQLYQQAVRENKTLYVWVDYWCPSSQDQLTNALHYKHRTKNWQLSLWDSQRGSWGTVPVTGPAVVKLVPRSPGWLHFEKTVLARDCCAASLASGPSPQGLSSGSRASGAG